MATPGRALPQPTPETQHFWDGTKANELLAAKKSALSEAEMRWLELDEKRASLAAS